VLNFAELPLAAPLQRALVEVNYVALTPVQAASLPAILAGRDVTAQAMTGSGKTAVFALGLLSTLDAARAHLQGLVLCPTRELADQVSREIRRLACFIPNVKVLTLCGGIPVRVHLSSLAHAPHIVVGTPGRVLDLLEQNALSLANLQTLVLDEADRMLDMGFTEELNKIIERAPKARQTLLFSATMPAPIRMLSRRYQQQAQEVTLASDAAETLIEQHFFEVEAAHKPVALASLLATRRPEAALVFCNTRDGVRTVTESLDQRGFSVLALHGELEQREREEILVRFTNHSCNVLIATDVAARGLDIKELAMVINFDLATDPDTHLHRIGRTGRAGHQGLALSLCTPYETLRAAQVAPGAEAIGWQRVSLVTDAVQPVVAPCVTLLIDAGRQDKLRPGDLLGALTGEAGVPNDAVGKIDVFATRTYVAVTREWGARAVIGLRAGKIKGRKFRLRQLA
jgi:ATP-dependent RNA helicase DbpA